MIERIAETVTLSWGWPRRLIALLAGAVSALAMAPFHLFLLLFLTFPVFVWLLDGAVASKKSGGVRRIVPAFAIGWWFGFGYFLTGLWWIGLAFLVDVDDFGWLMPFGVVLLPAFLAVVWGIGASLAQLLWSDGPGRIFALAFGLGLAEWARGTLFTGFPWNAIGQALAAGDVMMQSAALFGQYALNVMAVAIFAAPAALVPARPGWRRFAAPVLALAALAGLAGFGVWRLAEAGPPVADGRPLRLIQPAIDQSAKWQAENRAGILDSYRALSNPADAPIEPGTLLVWPETALPFAFTREPAALGLVADLLPEGAHLVTGAARLDEAEGARSVFNALYVVDDKSLVVDAYDKVDLVPFGEFVPFQGLVRAVGLGPMIDVRGAFAAGARRRVLAAGAGPAFVPLICYEIIFPGEAVPGAAEAGGRRPDLLLNLTNDTWFGRSPGPYQHLHQARIRAVEEGLPLVRAANSGISVATDAYGRVLAKLDLGASGRIDSRMAAAIGRPPAARHPFLIVLATLALAGVAAVAGVALGRRR